MSAPEKLLQSRATRQVVSLVVGLALGVFFHYLLFRLTLPIKPFIYVAF